MIRYGPDRLVNSDRGFSPVAFTHLTRTPMDFITNDPAQWKLTVIFLALLWIGFSLWRQGRRIIQVQMQLQAIQTAKARAERTAAGESSRAKMAV